MDTQLSKQEEVVVMPTATTTIINDFKYVGTEIERLVAENQELREQVAALESELSLWKKIN